MTIIQQLINKQYSSNNQFNKLIDKGMQIKELDLYLNNLDKQAKHYETASVSSKDVETQLKLRKQNVQLLQILQHNITNLILNSNIELEQIFDTAQLLQRSLSDDIDMVELDDKVQSYKLYMVAKLVADNAKLLMQYSKQQCQKI